MEDTPIPRHLASRQQHSLMTEAGEKEFDPSLLGLDELQHIEMEEDKKRRLPPLRWENRKGVIVHLYRRYSCLSIPVILASAPQ